MMLFSDYLIAGGLAWFLAQFTKYVLVTIKNKKLDTVNRLYLSGGMPSAHSATTISVLTVIGLKDGTDTSIFALTALLASIVIYDAIMVRRSSGEQGIALLNFMNEQKSKVKKPFLALGHNWIEVLVGSILGFVIGLAVVGY